MKRRTFLTASSTVGIASIAPGGLAVSSIYASISANVLLADFSTPTRSVLDKFMTDTMLNIQSLELDENLAKSLVTPVQIISNKSTGANHKIIYKNRSGAYISLSVNKGVEQIRITKTEK